MKRGALSVAFLWSFLVFSVCIAQPLWAGAIIIDHTCTNLSKVPQSWIDLARLKLRVTYGHTSHGSQVVTGIEAFRGNQGSAYYFTISGSGYNAGVFLNDNGIPGASDLGSPDRTAWASATRNLLNRAGGCDRNVVIWSWCGQVDGTPAEINTYLSLMNQLEIEFPQVTFVYMTGHLNGTGQNGNVNQRNEQIRSYCRANNKVLFDFADIESYDPDGAINYMILDADDGCNYLGGNWAQQWIAAYPNSELTQLAAACGSCAHSETLNCILKGRAFWWLMARLAGWPGPVRAIPALPALPGLHLLLMDH